MQVLAEKQHTPEWYEARRGRITASETAKCLSGSHTKGHRNYVEKIVDALDGIPDFDDHELKPWFANGIYYESFARGWYSFKFDIDVKETGFVVHDDFDWIGCSPDGLLGSDGLIEIKNRDRLSTFKLHARKGVVDPQPQIQTQLFVTGRKWCDYVNYWRDDVNEFEKGHVQRVHRNDAYIENTLLPAFVRFWQEVQEQLVKREAKRCAS